MYAMGSRDSDTGHELYKYHYLALIIRAHVYHLDLEIVK
jgi:hypothetical protein